MHAGTSGFAFLLNINDGGHGNVDIPNHYTKAEIGDIDNELSILIEYLYENRSRYIFIY